MNIESTFEFGGVTLTARNTARQTLKFRKVLERMPPPDKKADPLPDADFRESFRWLAGFGVTLTGTQYKLPEITDDFEASYQAMLDHLPARWILDAADAVYALLRPLADEVEKPDHTLTPEQSTDPNS